MFLLCFFFFVLSFLLFFSLPLRLDATSGVDFEGDMGAQIDDRAFKIRAKVKEKEKQCSKSKT